MKILWFTNTESNYSIRSQGYNGGGWISSLETQIRKIPSIQLAISFVTDNINAEDVQNAYYPIKNPFNKSVLYKIKKILLSRNEIDAVFVKEYLNVIERFKPDVIEIFGSENSYGLISKYTDIPIILHVQGIMYPCFQAFLPPSFSLRSFIYNSFRPHIIYRELRGYRFFKHGALREIDILASVKYYFGRTEWDKRLTMLFSPKATYYYCGEILRKEFYIEGQRMIPKKLTIVSTNSSPIFKGYDVILKTAKVLKEVGHCDFQWIVYGNIIRSNYIEKNVGISPSDVNVKLSGVANSETLRNSILKATCFVHPSYIDNSPNSVCEAQILGCTVISTNVGGISSLIEDCKTGFLVPANDPCQMAYLIIQIHTNRSLNTSIGNAGRTVALARHNPEIIVRTVVDTYKQIVKGNF